MTAPENPYELGSTAATSSAEDDSITGDSAPPQPTGWLTEDWLSVLLGFALLALVLLSVIWGGQATEITTDPDSGEQISETVWVNPLKPWIGKPGKWLANPLTAFGKWPAILSTFAVLGVVGLLAGMVRGRFQRGFLLGLTVLLLLSTVAYTLAAQEVVKNYNLEYALWALLLGLIISNTVGTPGWLRSAAMTELYIKTGLVILGAEILFGRLLALGLPGICVAWVVTPIVLISTFWFGQRVLKIQSASLNMVISADMSVCGVSAAIATAAACRAKKEELSLAIGMSLGFTVLMMVIMPPIILWLELPTMVGGAWLGGTIDSTGAVAAAGAFLGPEALEVAATVKMIQNILIGVVAFAVAGYWVKYREQDAGGDSRSAGVAEIWRRFPRFILGFVLASLVFSVLASSGSDDSMVLASTSVSKSIRGWLFCLAFVSIGLETNFAALSRFMAGGKPLLLYVVGQSLNILLTFCMAWLVFGKLYPTLVTFFAP